MVQDGCYYYIHVGKPNSKLWNKAQTLISIAIKYIFCSTYKKEYIIISQFSYISLGRRY